jgi:predicted phosphohydrolase
MIYLRIMSDLHLEREMERATYEAAQELGQDARKLHVDDILPFLWQPPPLDTDFRTILVLAGDIWNRLHHLVYVTSSGDNWITLLAKRFRAVIFLHGNHDYWGNDLSSMDSDALKLVSDTCPLNVHLLYNSHIDLDGFRFVGAPLWTDFQRGDPRVLMRWREMMKPDSMLIFCNDLKITAEDVYRKHQESLLSIVDGLESMPNDMKAIVVTHMAPLRQSVHPRYHNYRDDLINPYYYSDLSEVILDHKPWMWIHGHMHHTDTYLFDETMVVLNAKGYLYSRKIKGQTVFETDPESKDFNPYFLFDPHERRLLK